jgi:Methyltransferase domain
MGDLYPAAQIVGVDISPSMPTFVPPNVTFQIDDVEEPWTFLSPFDYIHSRYMAGSIQDWPKLMAQCFEYGSSPLTS